MKNLSQKAKELRNAYMREWKKNNPEKLKQYNINYWERKAEAYSIIQKAKDLSRQGLSQRKIAEALNVSVGTINRYLNMD